nr:protein kinase [Neobacillus sp. Marseille-Q6967]
MYKRLILLAANRFEGTFKIHEWVADRYRVVQHLGTGSYGQSYLVFDNVLKQHKVLKALRVHKRATRSGRKEFEFEKELLKSINHSGFPKYYEDGIYKNIPFFTMEHIEGKNFEQLIFQDGNKYSETEAFRFSYELLDLIEYLHKNNIIHRDIRIPNILLSGTYIRLIDLGLARKVEQQKTKEIKTDRDIRKGIHPQADFYGLGHVLLFLLYSNFTFPDYMKERSWEEELDISNGARNIIKRLLQIETPYENSSQIKSDIMKVLNQ